jgi:uncharacterized membrane protein HdeD (DUF308 family)
MIMFQTNNTLTKASNKSALTKICLIALVATFFVTFAVALGIVPAFAGAGVPVDTGALDSVMGTVISIVSTAALYIGIVIVLWGVFQIILAFRREDSEGISKQITTVVVGAVLTGFGAFAESIYEALI